MFMTYDPWDKEYLDHKSDYDAIFNTVMTQPDMEKIELSLPHRKYTVPVASATDALQFSLAAYNIGPGDEVLVSDFSWISSASCISMVGATPVFCDIDLDTYHVSLDSIKRMTTANTKALIYTHLFGSMSDTTEILTYCKDNDIIFIEDAAQSYGSSLNGVEAGTIGDCSSFSFNSNKVIAGLNGGGVFLTDEQTKANYVEKAARHGRNEFLGRNSKMYMLNCEVIKYRMQYAEQWQKRRQEIAKIYDEELSDSVVVQPVAEGLNHNYHKYVIRYEDNATRERVRKATGFKVHYPVNLSCNLMYFDIEAMLTHLPHDKDVCANSLIASSTVLSLPIHPYMSEEDIDNVLNKLMVV